MLKLSRQGNDCKALAIGIRVNAVQSRAAVSDQTPDASPTCASSDTAVATVTAQSWGCQVRLTTAQTKGDSVVTITVTIGTAPAYSQAVTLRVWYPTATAITLSDSTLETIVAGDTELADVSCHSPIYQSAHIVATATFGGTDLIAVEELDVTCSSSFKSSDAAVATVSGTEVFGEAVGTAAISFSGSNVVATSAAVTVSATIVPVKHLLGALLTSITMTTTPTTIAVRDDQKVVSQGELKHELDAEVGPGR